MSISKWKIYDYVDENGKNEIESWCRSLQKSDLGRLNRKLQMLEENGPNLGPKLLAGPIKGYPHLRKLCVRGNVQLRPLLCKGPIDNEQEFTLLKGAFEVGYEYSPAGALADADIRRQEVIRNAPTRRCPHVKVVK